MPRNVRNFWVYLEVDGRRTKIGTGPAASDGGFSLEIKQNDDGGVAEVLNVIGSVDHNKNLHLKVIDPEEGTLLYHLVTRRGLTDKEPLLVRKNKVQKFESDPVKLAAIRYFKQFEKLAEKLSNEELQALFGKCLAGRL